jgi:MFS transporter, AAHS family, 3-hydroxyphenylpropionic acid transporter
MMTGVGRFSLWPAGISSAVLLSCFLVASLEGIDIQSMGVAAPLIAPEFHLNPSQIGIALSASLLGLLAGAAVGGWLADLFSRRLVLMGSLAVLGVFSLVTTLCWDWHSLVAARLLTGLGMGGVFPTLIALVAESSNLGSRSTAISLVYCGMPFGGAVAGGFAALAATAHVWRPVFLLGGFGPLALIPVLLASLPADVRNRRHNLVSSETPAARSFATALFTRERRLNTSLLWLSYFFTLLIVYVLLNWLPSLMVANGFSKPQGIATSMLLNLGAVVGSITLGVSLDRTSKSRVILFAYAGMAVSLCALAALHALPLVLAAAFLCGFFAIGGQLVLYAISPTYYPAALRGTGIGAAVAVGRLGAIAGPLVVGYLLSSGHGAATVLMTAIPGLFLGGCAAFTLARRPTAAD